MSKFTGIILSGLVLCASVFAGSGTENDPYTIAEALALSEGTTEYWAQGYIVGGAYNNFDSPWTSDYSISCADTDSESDVNNCLQVKLESDGGRAAWGLGTNPNNFQKLIKFQGYRDAYGTYPSFEGVDNVDISEVALENQPPVLTAIGNKMVIEGNTLSFTVTATDSLDGDSISLSATGLPAGAVFAGATNAATASSTFTWTNAGPLGDYSVTFTASDKDGTVQQVVGITVHDGSGPLEIAFQGFEGTASDTWGTTDIDATLVRSTTGTADTPADVRIRTGTYSWQPGEGEYTTEALELAAVDVSEWSDVVVTLHVSATTTVPEDGFGMFPTETLSVWTALDGANFPAAADIVVSGNQLASGSITGALWSYTATGVAATTAGVSRTVAPASGGVTDDGIATVQIALPAGTTSVKLKAEVAQEYAGYFWNVDDISLTGINDGGASDFPPTIAVSPEGLDKSVAVDKNLSFTINASEIPNDASDEVRIWAMGLPAGATFVGATNTGSASSVFSWTPTEAGETTVTFFAGDKDGTNQLDVGITAYEMGAGGAAYAVVVGLNEYNSSYIGSGNWLNGCEPDANHIFTNILKRGDWNVLSAQKKLSAAGTKAAIRGAIANYAATAVAGDTFFYFHSSHGGQNSGTSVYLCTYDSDYEDTELAADLSQFAAGVKVVVMVDACHSGGLFKSVQAGTRAVRPTKGGWDLAGIVSQIMDEQRAAKLAAGKRDVLSRVSSSEIGWITAADYDQYSWDGGPNGGGVFTDKVIEGWTNNPPNSCDLNGDNYANFYELWDYAWDVANSADLEYTTAMAHNTNVLLNTMAGWVGEAAPGGLIVFSNMTAQTILVGETLIYPVGASTAGTNVPVTVTMTTVQDGASYAGGELTFTPTTDGTTTFNFSGTNANGGSATASLTVTATLPAPTLADPATTEVGNDRFTANWNDVVGAASYLLDVATSDTFSAGSAGADVLDEDFATLTDTSVPGGWTTSGSSDLDYTGAGYYGEASPAYKFKTTGQWLVSPAFATGATNLQFWALGNGGSGSTFAISGLVNSVWTLVDTVTIAEDGATYNVALEPQTTQIGFYFTKVKNCGLDDVIVQASDAGSSTLVVEAQSVAGTSYEVTGLAMDTTYYFRVRAVGNLNGPYSITGTAHTTATDTPPSFDAIPAQSASVGVLLSLDVSAYDSGYPAPALTLESSTANAADYGFTDGTLSFTPSAAGNVEFVFMASNTLGTALATANVAVASAPVYIPVASIADVTSDSLTVNWTPCTGATDYQVQVSTDSVFAADSGGNLMVNGGFEMGDDTGWDKFEADYSVVSTDPQEGNYHVTCAATGTRDLMQPVTIIGDGVTEYEVSFWYKKPTAGGNARIWSPWDIGGQVSGDNLQPSTYLQAASEWTKVTYHVVPSSGENILKFEVRTYTGATVDWDNFFVGESGPRGSVSKAILVDETVSALSVPVTGLDPETLYFARARMAGGEWSDVVSDTTLAAGPTAPSFAAIPPQSATVGVEFLLDVSAYDSGNPAPALS
ncbi:MAG: caspase family protein, partial [Kiritimatiellia bacterium]|nr:caspase family protein [Kiritimatiellia bacterium]